MLDAGTATIVFSKYAQLETISDVGKQGMNFLGQALDFRSPDADTISVGLGVLCTPAQRDFLIGHELSHLQFGDTDPTAVPTSLFSIARAKTMWAGLFGQSGGAAADADSAKGVRWDEARRKGGSEATGGYAPYKALAHLELSRDHFIELRADENAALAGPDIALGGIEHLLKSLTRARIFRKWTLENDMYRHKNQVRGRGPRDCTCMLVMPCRAH